MKRVVFAFALAALVSVGGYAACAGTSSVSIEEAREFYDEAVEFKAKGQAWESKRKANLCIKAAPNSEYARKAQMLIKTQLPKNDVSKEAQGMNNAAYNLMINGSIDHAKASFSRICKLYPDFEYPVSNLGIIYMQQGNFGMAKFYFKKALKINPNFVNAWHNLAVCHFKTTEYKEAYDCCQRILKIDPNEPDAAILMNQVKRHLPPEGAKGPPD